MNTFIKFTSRLTLFEIGSGAFDRFSNLVEIKFEENSELKVTNINIFYDDYNIIIMISCNVHLNFIKFFYYILMH